MSQEIRLKKNQGSDISLLCFLTFWQERLCMLWTDGRLAEGLKVFITVCTKGFDLISGHPDFVNSCVWFLKFDLTSHNLICLLTIMVLIVPNCSKVNSKNIYILKTFLYFNAVAETWTLVLLSTFFLWYLWTHLNIKKKLLIMFVFKMRPCSQMKLV